MTQRLTRAPAASHRFSFRPLASTLSGSSAASAHSATWRRPACPKRRIAPWRRSRSRSRCGEPSGAAPALALACACPLQCCLRARPRRPRRLKERRITPRRTRRWSRMCESPHETCKIKKGGKEFTEIRFIKNPTRSRARRGPAASQAGGKQGACARTRARTALALATPSRAPVLRPRRCRSSADRRNRKSWSPPSLSRSQESVSARRWSCTTVRPPLAHKNVAHHLALHCSDRSH